MEGRFPPILAPQRCHGGDTAHVAVLDPVGELLHGAAAHIAGEIGLAPELAGQFHELMGAEGVILADAAPVGVDDGLALRLRADTIAPVVGIGKAAARPAQHRDVQRLERIDNIAAHTVDVGNLRVFADIKALIDAAAQMLRELTVDIRVNGAE